MAGPNYYTFSGHQTITGTCSDVQPPTLWATTLQRLIKFNPPTTPIPWASTPELPKKELNGPEYKNSNLQYRIPIFHLYEIWEHQDGILKVWSPTQLNSIPKETHWRHAMRKTTHNDIAEWPSNALFPCEHDHDGTIQDPPAYHIHDPNPADPR